MTDSSADSTEVCRFGLLDDHYDLGDFRDGISFFSAI